MMKLSSTLPSHQNYKVFADNLFSSASFVSALLKLGIHYVGTLRNSRLNGCDLASERELQRKGRGSVDFRVEREKGIAIVRWYDNKRQ